MVEVVEHPKNCGYNGEETRGLEQDRGENLFEGIWRDKRTGDRYDASSGQMSRLNCGEREIKSTLK